MTLGTRIAVLNEGRLVQFDTPRRIYREPASRFVAGFIGRPAMNTLDGVIEQGVFRAGAFALPVSGRPDGPAVLGIRPEALVLREQPTDDSIMFDLDVIELVEPDTLLFAKKDEVSMVARLMRDVGERKAGSPVHLELPPQHRHFFDARTGERLP
jgi:ABC-type sugar transport system ATPase subunit